MLVFRGSPKSSQKSIRHIDQMREEDSEALQKNGNQRIRRRLPKVLFMSMYFVQFHFQYNYNLIRLLNDFRVIEYLSVEPIYASTYH